MNLNLTNTGRDLILEYTNKIGNKIACEDCFGEPFFLRYLRNYFKNNPEKLGLDKGGKIEFRENKTAKYYPRDNYIIFQIITNNFEDNKSGSNNHHLLAGLQSLGFGNPKRDYLCGFNVLNFHISYIQEPYYLIPSVEINSNPSKLLLSIDYEFKLIDFESKLILFDERENLRANFVVDDFIASAYSNPYDQIYYQFADRFLDFILSKLAHDVETGVKDFI
jgi:hypothetical protein